jgi:hypothetical protein
MKTNFENYFKENKELNSEVWNEKSVDEKFEFIMNDNYGIEEQWLQLKELIKEYEKLDSDFYSFINKKNRQASKRLRKNFLHKEIKNAMKEILIRLNNSNLGDGWEGIVSIFMNGNGNLSLHGYIQYKDGKAKEKVFGNLIKENEVCIINQRVFINNVRKIKNEFELFISSYKNEINELCQDETLYEDTLDADIEKYLNKEAEHNQLYK